MLTVAMSGFSTTARPALFAMVREALNCSVGSLIESMRMGIETVRKVVVPSKARTALVVV